MYADLNYYRKTEKKKSQPLLTVAKTGGVVLLTAYLLVKFVEPILASGIY